jgi:hypothetical protein
MDDSRDTTPSPEVELGLVRRALERSMVVVLVIMDDQGRVLECNEAFARVAGVPAAGLRGTGIARFLTEPDGRALLGWAAGEAPPEEPTLLNFARPGQDPVTLRCMVERSGAALVLLGEADVQGSVSLSEELIRVNNELATMTREMARQGRELARAKDELGGTLENLRTSYWHLRKIQEYLPVCMGCGKVKTDAVRWESLVQYLRDNQVFLSHGYCPKCYETLAQAHSLDPES